MACKNICKLCDKLVISTGVAFTLGNLDITIPEGSYYDGEKVCIVVTQTIPATATINAPVFIRIGDGAQLYPLNKCNCEQLTACGIKTRTKYSTIVHTSGTTGNFRLLGKIDCEPNNRREYINGDPA